MGLIIFSTSDGITWANISANTDTGHNRDYSVDIGDLDRDGQEDDIATNGWECCGGDQDYKAWKVDSNTTSIWNSENAQTSYPANMLVIDLDKDEIVKLASELKVPLEFTYSCYSGGGFKGKIPKHCGTCANCMDRKMGFYWAGVKDTSIYEKD